MLLIDSGRSADSDIQRAPGAQKLVALRSAPSDWEAPGFIPVAAAQGVCQRVPGPCNISIQRLGSRTSIALS